MESIETSHTHISNIHSKMSKILALSQVLRAECSKGYLICTILIRKKSTYQS